MTVSKNKSAWVGAGAMVLLTLLFVQQMPLDTRRHDGFVRDWQRLKQLDAEISRDLLSSRFGLLTSGDPFVQRLDEMRGIRERLQSIPSFLGRHNAGEIDGLLKQGSDLLSEKARLIEKFKSKNLLLHNSLRDYPG